MADHGLQVGGGEKRQRTKRGGGGGWHFFIDIQNAGKCHERFRRSALQKRGRVAAVGIGSDYHGFGITSSLNRGSYNVSRSRRSLLNLRNRLPNLPLTYLRIVAKLNSA